MTHLSEAHRFAQVHRFREFVALYVSAANGTGATVYLEPDAARAIAASLVAGADDCDARQFSESAFGTHIIEPGAKPPADTRRIYRIVRNFERGNPIRRHQLLTLAEAQAHCQDPETSSSTAVRKAGVTLTRRFGRWFDSYEVHPKFKGQEG